MSTEQAVKDLLTRYTGHADIAQDALLFDLFEDELDLLEFEFDIEDLLGVELPLDVKQNIETVGDMVGALQEAQQTDIVTAPKHLSPKDKLDWMVRFHLGKAANSTAERVQPEWDLADDMGVPELAVGFFVQGFVETHFGFKPDMSEANRVMRVADLITLVTSAFENAGLDCLCATTFFHPNQTVSMIACMKECPRKSVMTALGAFPGGQD